MPQPHHLGMLGLRGQDMQDPPEPAHLPPPGEERPGLVYCYVCGGHADDEGICLIPCLGWELLDVERPLRPDEVEASRQQAMDRWGSIAYHVGLYQPHE